MEFKDYYDVLGVPAGADADVIKSAYRKLARKFHPDVSKETDAEEKFKAVNEAYEVLKDGKRRAAYDRLRARGFRPGEAFRPPPNWGDTEGFEFDGADVGNDAHFSEFFESLFGRARPGARPTGGRRRPRESRARLTLSLEQAYQGGKQRIQVGKRTLEVQVPAGVQSGQQIRLGGQGEEGGDLILEVVLAPHPRFEVAGRDVTVRVRLAPWEAAQGALVAVPTLGGAVEMKIPAGTASGARMRLRGRGLPGTPSGDQYVVIDLAAPVPTSKQQEEAYRQLAQAFAGYDPRA
jgi:curved DNA-binding protein